MNNNNYKVLIVDDVDENLQVVWGILEESNITVSIANSGLKAIKIARKKLPDLILLDINMPEMNGYETCEILKNDELTKHIPIIFLSALNEKDDIVRGFKYGAVDYITKPFYKAELLSRVITHLDLKNSKDLIKKQNNELKELNDTKDKFFSIIAHDLKNPFNTLINFSDLLKRNFYKFTDEKKIQFIDFIHSSSETGYKILENLLEWSRLQTGRISYDPTDFDLISIINSNLTLVKTTAIDKDIEIISELPENIIVRADYNMVDTVFRNLVSNALKFTDKGGKIVVAIKAFDSTIKVSVKDTGVGIKPENISKLFRIDQSYSTHGTEKEKGTGLGLVLCKEFVEKNEGEIWVKSVVNEGSEFTFSLMQGKLKTESDNSFISEIICDIKQEKNIHRELITILKNDFIPKTEEFIFDRSVNNLNMFS